VVRSENLVDYVLDIVAVFAFQVIAVSMCSSIRYVAIHYAHWPVCFKLPSMLCSRCMWKFGYLRTTHSNMTNLVM